MSAVKTKVRELQMGTARLMSVVVVWVVGWIEVGWGWWTGACVCGARERGRTVGAEEAVVHEGAGLVDEVCQGRLSSVAAAADGGRGGGMRRRKRQEGSLARSTIDRSFVCFFAFVPTHLGAEQRSEPRPNAAVLCLGLLPPLLPLLAARRPSSSCPSLRRLLQHGVGAAPQHPHQHEAPDLVPKLVSRHSVTRSDRSIDLDRLVEADAAASALPLVDVCACGYDMGRPLVVRRVESIDCLEAIT